LVVDDEEAIRRLLQTVLHSAGYKVHTAANGAEAVKTFAAHARAIDLVILDYAMPGMSGGDLFHELRRQNPNVRVILSSGHAGGQEIRAMPGLLAVVPKPFRIQDMLRAVRDAAAE
jgi:CheY-like chemotaxis protein